MRTIVRRFSIAAAAALVGSTFGLVSAARADTFVTCGQVITTSIFLANNVGPCLGDGLIVRGNNITIDLNGHTVTGDSLNPAAAVDQAGVHLDNVSGVKVTRGTVRGFFVGVLVQGGSGNTVTNDRIDKNIGLGTTLYNDGVILDGSTNNKVTYLTVTGNGPDAGIAMIRGASHNQILYNHVTDNHVPAIGVGPGGVDQQVDSGISNDTDSDFNLIADNYVLRNGFFGIALAGQGTSHDQAIHNTIRDNGNAGINAGGNGHTVERNTIIHNGYEQFLPVGGIREYGSIDGVITCGQPSPPGRPCGNDPAIIKDNLIDRNAGNGIALYFNGNQFLGGCGIYGCFPGSPYAPPRSNLVQHNIVRNNGRDGILVICDTVYDASFNGSCLTTTPPHMGQRILNNITSGNGGIGAGTTFWDLHDQNPGCDDDIWSGNLFVTANPPCTTG